jgi:hypothetical protein
MKQKKEKEMKKKLNEKKKVPETKLNPKGDSQCSQSLVADVLLLQVLVVPA